LLVFEVPGALPVKRVQDVWSTYTELDVSPLSASESMAKGIRSEKLEEVKGLKEAIAR
jgi:phosphomevalonate kinase